MKNKGLQFGLAFIIVGTIGAFSFLSVTDNTPLYKPRKTDAPRGIAGAIQYYFDIKKNPATNSIDYADVYNTLTEVQSRPTNKSAALGLNWQELGPDNVGGRTRAVLIDKNNPNRIYAGGVAGGLWVSNDAASTWSMYSGYLENVAVTCITQAANGDIYFGTGEGLYTPTGTGSAGVVGGGVWKSTDGGNTFNRLSSTIPTPNMNASNLWVCVNQIAAHPTNSNRIYAATSFGLMMTDDGGDTWDHPIRSGASPLTGITQDVEVLNDGTVIVAGGQAEYYSTSGDYNTFTLKHTFAGASRIEFAVAPSDNNYVYAAVARASDNKVLGIYQSIDKGQTWTQIGPGGSTSTFTPFGTVQGQGNYDNAMAVSPTDKGKIILGGVELWAWQQITPSSTGVGQWDRIANLEDIYVVIDEYVHADVHTVKYLPSNPNIVYVGTDGGVFKSTDGGVTWVPKNKGLNITQFYSIAFEANGANGTGVLGGTQDNSNQYISGLGNTPQWSEELYSGDGAYAEISFINPRAFFMESQYGNLVRSSNKGEVPAPFFSARLVASNPSANFVAPFALYENINDTNSVDSVLFVASRETQLKHIGNGSEMAFSGTLVPNQPSASIVPDSVVISVGAQVLVDDGAGNLTGSGTGTINHATGVYSFTFTAAPANGAPVNIAYDVMYNPGSVVTVISKVSQHQFPHTFTNALLPLDSVMVQDKVVAKFAMGFSGNHGVWITKEALDFSKVPEWFKIGTLAGTAQCMAWSSDGDLLYVGTDGGQLFRFSNLAAIKDSATGDIVSANTVVVKTQIAGFARTVTGVNVDPNNPERVIVTLGGYYGAANSPNIWYSSTAASSAASTGTANFTGVQGTGPNKLPSMPAYSAIFEMNNPNTVIVATEYGIYATDDITQPAASIVWTEENNGNRMMRVPTFMIRQQTKPGWNVNNSGTIYIGTHGRGAWKDETYKITTGIGDNGGSDTKSVAKPSIKIYPNPLNGEGYVNIELNKATVVVVRIFDLQGKEVQQYRTAKLAGGQQNIAINSNGLPAGTYLLSVDADEIHAVSKFIVTQ